MWRDYGAPLVAGTFSGELWLNVLCKLDFADHGRVRLACRAFKTVFQRKQTQHAALMEWLEGQLAAVPPVNSAERRMLEDAVKAGQAGRADEGGMVGRGVP
jgi:hypothetical protein